MIFPAQPAVFAQTTSPAPSLVASFEAPTTIGNTIQIHLRFSPTGVPSVKDNYANRVKLVATYLEAGSDSAAGFWAIDIARGGINHAVTVTAMGAAQSLDLGMTELSICAAHPDDHSSDRDIGLTQVALLNEIKSLLQRIAKAERA